MTVVEDSAHWHQFFIYQNQMATSPMKHSSPLHYHCLLSLLLLALFPYSTTTSSPAKISYVDHCESIVPRSAPTGGPVDYSSYISLSNGFLSGGDELLAPENSSHLPTSATPSSPGYFYFYSQNLHPTRSPGVFKLGGSLSLHGPSQASFSTDSSGRRRHRARRNGNVTLHNYRKAVNFEMTGFWSKPSGKICMVGSGYFTTNQGTNLNPTAVFKLNYPRTSDISASLANGSVESLDATTSPAHFGPVSLLVYAPRNYSYTKIPQARHACSSHADDVPKGAIGFGDAGSTSSSSSTCSYLQNMLNGRFELEYVSACSVLNCSLLGFAPRFMSWNLVECSEGGKVHMYIGFSRDDDGDDYERHNVMEPEKSLVAEGVWDPEKNRLCVLAFPIMIRKDSAVDASVGEATVGISLWFPGVLSIESRSTTVGRIWSEKAASGSLRNSEAISFRNFDANYGYLPGTRYEYTRTQDVNKSCGSSPVGNSENRRYPDGNSIGDLRFDISLSNNEGYSAWGSATPLSLGESFYGYSIGSISPVLVQESATFEEAKSATIEEVNPNPVLWNVSYNLSYRAFNRSSAMKEVVDISAEGIYNAGTGIICMVGCRDKNNSNLHKNPNGYSMDCEILISLQLAPMNTGDGNGSSYGAMHLNGTIRSTRKKHDDPLYFEPLVLSSHNMYAAEATEAVRRMDVEIVMVLVSKTLSCIFIGLQLFHVRKHPEVLPSMSIVMLVVLTLGHVIPLVLNFEALFFTNRNRQNVLLWSGGWLEANEVVVRLMTMLAFLLQLRLLQSAWSARSSDENRKSLGVAERKALRFCLPLYFAGALIAWFFHTRSYQNQSDFRDFDPQPNHSIWEDLISYAGLILDGFLLPQIILNMIGNCTEKALSPLYYVGITVVRAFPHVYDAYRSRYYLPSFDSSIIFATSHEDFYSCAWDIIILFGGVIFAVLIFFQQKFGGSCFLPKRFRSVSGGYELVSVATT